MDPFEPASWWKGDRSTRRPRLPTSSVLCLMAARFLQEVRGGSDSATVFATHAAVVELTRMNLEARLADAGPARRHRRAFRACVDELICCQRELAAGRPGAAGHAVDALVALLVELDAGPSTSAVDGVSDSAGDLEPRRPVRAGLRRPSGRYAKSFDHLPVQQGQA